MRAFLKTGLCRSARVMVLTATVLGASVSLAQAQYVYPSQGQSPEQQRQDEFDCHQWAVQQTGVDPTRGGQSAPDNTGSQALRGAAGGALLGGLIGSMDGNWGKGAAIGAGAGGLLGGMRGRSQTNQQQAYRDAQIQEYQRAKVTCLVGRGYTVN